MTPLLSLNSYNLLSAERKLILAALQQTGTIVGAAGLLGLTRHALKRRLIKHNIPHPSPSSVDAA